jgi:hypothetical protein
MSWLLLRRALDAGIQLTITADGTKKSRYYQNWIVVAPNETHSGENAHNKSYYDYYFRTGETGLLAS